MNRKIIIIAVASAAGLSLLTGILLLIFRHPAQVTSKPVVTQAPEAKKLTDDSVISPIPAYDGGGVWYFNSDGHLFRINTDGSGLTEYPLPALTLGKLTDVLWPKTGNDFIARISNQSGTLNKYYDSQQKKYVDLPPNIQSLAWLADSKRIVYIWRTSDKAHQQLAFANADGSGYRVVADVFWPDLIVYPAPKGMQVLLIRSITQGDINKIYLADLGTGEIQTAVGEGKNLDALWLADANRFVYSQVTANLYPKLFLYNLASGLALDLNLATAINKVAVDDGGKLLYAAVSKADNTSDEIWKVDLTTLKHEKVLDLPASMHAQNLQVTASALYFVNMLDGKLYYVSR